jgi:hypothetical protein
MGQVKVIPVVIDTNIVLSGLLFGGKVGKIVTMWKNGRIQPFLSQKIMDEYIRVLTYPKFSFSEQEINYLLYREILPYFEVIEPAGGPVVIKNDPSDDMFLYCALSAAVDCIISGDSHLLDLAEFKGIPIVTPEQFLKKA